MRYWLAALVLLIATVAYADLPIREVDVTWSRGAPKVSFSAMDLADERVRRELSTGLRKRLVVTVGSHLKGSGWRMATRQFGCAVTLDLWDDDYLVRVGNRTERLKTLDDVLNRCLDVQGLFAGEPKSYEPQKGREIYFVIKAEFNPISQKQCSELIRPTSGGDSVAPITANIVRRQICRAERSIEFRSPLVKVPQ